MLRTTPYAFVAVDLRGDAARPLSWAKAPGSPLAALLGIPPQHTEPEVGRLSGLVVPKLRCFAASVVGFGQQILSAGGVPEDPLYEVIEMAELDADTGEWIFRALDLHSDPLALGDSDASCQGCHGNPVRPIWGNDPDWPGAFGENENDLTWARQWFDLRGDARDAWLREFDLYESDLRPRELLPASQADMCGYLDNR